jgi:hypothetical protein
MLVEKNEDGSTEVCEYVRFHGLQKLQKGFTQVDARVLLFTNLQQALEEEEGGGGGGGGEGAGKGR